MRMIKFAKKAITFRFHAWYYRALYALSKCYYRIVKNGTTVLTPKTLGVRVVSPGIDNELIELPERYIDLVRSIHAEAVLRMSVPSNCNMRCFDKNVEGLIRERRFEGRTWDMPEYTEGKIFNIKLNFLLDIDAVHELCDILIPQLERHIFGCHLSVNELVVFRSPVCDEQPISSKLWHTDNQVDETIKIMIYLNDVDDGSAPFTYLTNEQGDLIRIPAGFPSRYPASRIPPEAMDGYIKRGYFAKSVTGSQGTCLIFDQKNIHRGTQGRTGHRDALVLRVQPRIWPRSRYVDSALTKNHY